MGSPITRADCKSIDLQMLPRGQGHKAEARVMSAALFTKSGTQAFGCILACQQEDILSIVFLDKVLGREALGELSVEFWE